MPSIKRARVVFPLPLSPATAMMPGFSRGMPKLTSSTATVILRRSSPPRRLGDVLQFKDVVSAVRRSQCGHRSILSNQLNAPSYMWQATHRRGSFSFKSGSTVVHKSVFKRPLTSVNSPLKSSSLLYMGASRMESAT